MRHERENRAMARGSAFPVQSWHRCRRYWRRGLECAFHGKEEKKDRDDVDPDDAPQESGKPVRKRTGPKPVVSTVDELKPRAHAEAQEEKIPVTAGVRGDPRQKPQWQEEAFPDVGPLSVPVVPAAPKWKPLYIPDENIPEWTPPGMQRPMASVGPSSEEAFVQMVSQETSTMARETTAGQEGEAGFGALAIAFTAMFTANAVGHLWQTYNAGSRNAPQGVELPPISRRTDGKSKSSRKRNQPAKSRKSVKAKPPKSTRPLPQPVKSTVGAGGGRATIFKAQIFSRSPGLPISQGAFTQVFERTLNRPIVLGGGQDED